MPGCAVPPQRGPQPPPHRPQFRCHGRLRGAHPPRPVLLRRRRQDGAQALLPQRCSQVQGHQGMEGAGQKDDVQKGCIFDGLITLWILEVLIEF